MSIEHGRGIIKKYFNEKIMIRERIIENIVIFNLFLLLKKLKDNKKNKKNKGKVIKSKNFENETIRGLSIDVKNLVITSK